MSVITFTLINIPLHDPGSRSKTEKWYQKCPRERKGNQVQKIGLTPNDKANEQEAERLNTNPLVTSIVELDNPKNYLRIVPDIAALLHRHEVDGNPLGLEEPRDGWYAQHYEVIGHAQDENLEGCAVIRNYGNKIGYRSASPELLTNRLNKELGYSSFNQYATAIGRLKEIRLGYIGTDIEIAPANEVQHIKRLHNEVKNGTCFSCDGEPIPESLILAQLIDRMSRLEEAKIEANNVGDNATKKSYQDALDELYRDLGLKLDFRDNFVFGRQAKGMTLKAPQLKIVIKKAGSIPDHRINTDGEINYPEATNDSVIVTTRGQIADRLEQGITEPLAKALGINSGLYVLGGIETQEIVKGEDLNNLLSNNPTLLTKTLYKKLVKIALIHELLGGECTDWSLHNFIVQGDIESDKFELKLVDLGNSKLITEASGDMDKRLNALRNIGNSARNNEEIIKRRMSELYEEIVQTPSTLAGLVKEVEEQLKNKGLLIS